jgi:dipeptidase D
MNKNYEYHIGDISTKGGKENIICKDAMMTLFVKPSDVEDVLEGLNTYKTIFENEYSLTDTLEMTVEIMGDKANACVFPRELNERLTSAVLLIPYGVVDFSHKIENLVETSMNMGAIEYKDGRLHLLSSVRSSVSTRKAFIKDKLQVIGAHYCDEIQFLHEYPEWEYKAESKLRDVACDAYLTTFGREATVQAIHAGLECGYFYEKDNELDIISMGPDVYDIHTVNEKISKKSIGRIWAFIKEILHSL